MTILAALDPCVCRSAEGERSAPDCAADNRGDRSDSLCPAARREGPALRRGFGSPRQPRQATLPCWLAPSNWAPLLRLCKKERCHSGPRFPQLLGGTRPERHGGLKAPQAE